MTEYLGVLIYLALATGLGMVILTLVTKVRPRRLDLEKATAYECGFDPFGEARSPFDVGFYLVAILFLVFDLEVAYLLPWAVGGCVTGWAGFYRLMVFLCVLTIGFVYEWQKGALDWNSPFDALNLKFYTHKAFMIDDIGFIVNLKFLKLTKLFINIDCL